MTTAPFLHSSNKDIKEIQQIVISTELVNLAKHTVGAIANLTIIVKKKKLEKSKLKQNIVCFNYRKKSHYIKNCHSSTRNSIKRKLIEKSIKEVKQTWWKKNQAKIAKLISNNDNSNTEPYLASWVFITCKVDKKRKWYLDSYTSKHIYNNHKKFVGLRLKTFKFIMANGNIIRSIQVGTIILFFENNSNLIFTNIVHTLKCDSKLIFLCQLWDTRILYHNYAKYIVLKQKGKTIGLVTKKKNLFILNI